MLKAKLFDADKVGTDTRETYLVTIADETHLIEYWFDKKDEMYAVYLLDEELQDRVSTLERFGEDIHRDLITMCFLEDSSLA